MGSNSWGPSDQYRRPPRTGGGAGVLIVVGIVAMELWRHGALQAVVRLALAAAVIAVVVRVGRRLWALRATHQPVKGPRPGREVSIESLRDRVERRGRGALLGLSRGDWVCADPEHAVLVLGPPRSGKTTRVAIPALVSCPGAAASTSTKADVLAATARSRSEGGQVWLFDPTGEQPAGAFGARVLSWSPVAAAGSWDQALLMARAMTMATPAVGRGTQHEHHWSERAGALLAPLLFAANRSGQGIERVLRWVLRGELDEPAQTLEREGAAVACDVLLGIATTEERERSSIFSATAGVLALYNSDAARAAAARPNFDPAMFAAGTDTVYITAPAHRQALCAPLVVGLLEQIRHATYQRAAIGQSGPPVLFCLDEVANIAPIHDLPALVSEAGGQGLHVLACLQDLSQARVRWGEAAEGFLSLFQTKLILPGVCDPKTLEAISLVLGEYDRQLVSHTLGVTRSSSGIFAPTTTTSSESVSYQTARQRTLPAGEIAAIPTGNALLVRGAKWGLLQTTPIHASSARRELSDMRPQVAQRAARSAYRSLANSESIETVGREATEGVTV